MSKQYDVVIAGGGTAGIAAAVSAARGGARTLLVERDQVLGGNATLALVHTICGLYLTADAERAPDYANPGFATEFAEGLRRAGGAADPERVGRVWVLATSPPVLERYAASWCEETTGLECWRGSTVVGASLPEAGGSSALLIAEHEGRCVEVESSIVIDATGDAAVGELAGADTCMEPAGSLQCPSFIFRLGRVDGAVAKGFARLKLSVAAAGAVRHGDLPVGCESVMVRPALEPDAVYVTLNVAKLADRAYAPLDDEYRRELESIARTRCVAIVDFLKRTRSQFRDAEIAAWPRRIGIRETRRIRGNVMIDAGDVLDGRRHDEEVAVSSWPIELWDTHERPTLRYGTGACSIPLGALVSRTHPSLGVAGRCMSATHDALGALRVLGTALATGEAIGVAAALAAERGCGLDAVSPAQVRMTIRDRGHAG